MIKEEHAYKTFQKMLQSGVFPSVLLFFGKEAYLSDWAIKETKKALLNPVSLAMDLNRFSEEGLVATDIINACETLPLFSSRKIVTVEDCDIFFSGQSLQAESQEASKLANYIKNIPSTTLLIFTSTKADKRKSLYKAVVKSGIAYEFRTIEGKVLTDFVKKRLNKAGKTASDREIRAFIEMTGYADKDSVYTLYNMVNDLSKIIAISHQEALTLADFEESVAGNADTDAFALLDAAFSGDKGKALILLKNIISAEKQSYAVGAILRLIGLICSQLEIMLIAKERLADGDTMRALPDLMGIKAFRLQKALEAAGSRSTDKLIDSLTDGFRMEQDIKRGDMPAELVLELFIASL